MRSGVSRVEAEPLRSEGEEALLAAAEEMKAAAKTYRQLSRELLKKGVIHNRIGKPNGEKLCPKCKEGTRTGDTCRYCKKCNALAFRYNRVRGLKLADEHLPRVFPVRKRVGQASVNETRGRMVYVNGVRTKICDLEMYRSSADNSSRDTWYFSVVVVNRLSNRCAVYTFTNKNLKDAWGWLYLAGREILLNTSFLDEEAEVLGIYLQGVHKRVVNDMDFSLKSKRERKPVDHGFVTENYRKRANLQPKTDR